MAAGPGRLQNVADRTKDRVVGRSKSLRNADVKENATVVQDSATFESAGVWTTGRFPSAEACGAPCEMRRTPPQNKVDKPGSPRLTLRLHQVKGRDEKKSASQQKAADVTASETRLQFSLTMEGSKGDDVYEFKNSKDTTPVSSVHGSSVSSDAGSGNQTNGKPGGKENESKEAHSPNASQDKQKGEGSSKDDKKDIDASKRNFSEMLDTEEGDEETKRKKRKDDKSEGKENSRNGVNPGRSVGRNGSSDKGFKNGNTKNGNSGNKSNCGNNSTSDRKSPNSTGSAGNSPKSSGAIKSSGNCDSESESDETKKCSDVGTGGGPKVPPLKIVIPQQNSSEQDQGNRNGKNGTLRHQALPYVVTSSNDSDKDMPSSNSEGKEGNGSGGNGKGDDKKDSCSLSEERTQRVTRSSHRMASLHSNSTHPPNLPAESAVESPGSAKSDDKVEEHQSQQQQPPPQQQQQQSHQQQQQHHQPQQQQQQQQQQHQHHHHQQTQQQQSQPHHSVDVHPRKRKLKPKETEPMDTQGAMEVHPHDQPITNCYQLFLNIRKQIERRRKGLFPVQPKPPQGFKDYLMNRCTYVLAGNSTSRVSIPMISPPTSLQGPMKDLFTEQEKDRYRLGMQHVIEKEKLVLSVEQEILRVHGRAARALANQALPFSVCTILKDEEVYNVITPEQEEKDRNARSRYNGRLFLSWLQDVDDKWEKIKESMLLRHHNEAESLHAVQKMDWEWKMKELGLCEFKVKPVIDDLHVPMVTVSDDFDLLPA